MQTDEPATEQPAPAPEMPEPEQEFKPQEKPARAGKKLTLASALEEARRGLQRALKGLIAAQVPENELVRLKTENVFEALRTAKQPERADLIQAGEQLEACASTLANTSHANAEDLREVRTAASRAAKALEELAIPNSGA